MSQVSDAARNTVWALLLGELIHLGQRLRQQHLSLDDLMAAVAAARVGWVMESDLFWVGFPRALSNHLDC